MKDERVRENWSNQSRHLMLVFSTLFVSTSKPVSLLPHTEGIERAVSSSAERAAET